MKKKVLFGIVIAATLVVSFVGGQQSVQTAADYHTAGMGRGA
ncbi:MULTISPECIES: lysogeny pheromone AimP family peptide [unclassified Bacillus (in: firmicutes)]